MRRAGVSPALPRTLSDGTRAGGVVVGHAAQLQAAVVARERIGGAPVTVERDAHAARVHELHAVRTGPPEREMGVAEHEPARGRAGHELLVRRPPAPGGSSACRTAARRAHRAHRRRSTSGGSAASSEATSAPSSSRQRSIGRKHASGASWASSSQRSTFPRIQRGVERPQALDGLERPGAEERVVAAEEVAVDSCGISVRQHGLQGRQVPVHVIEDRERHVWVRRGSEAS